MRLVVASPAAREFNKAIDFYDALAVGLARGGCSWVGFPARLFIASRSILSRSLRSHIVLDGQVTGPRALDAGEWR